MLYIDTYPAYLFLGIVPGHRSVLLRHMIRDQDSFETMRQSRYHFPYLVVHIPFESHFNILLYNKKKINCN